MMSDTRFIKEGCLVDEDLYLYVSGQGDSGTLGRIEGHITQCPPCRRRLVEVLEILHPKDETSEVEIPAPSQVELDQTIAIIKEVAQKERDATRHRSFPFRWPLAAAAALALIALTLSLKYLYEAKKSQDFFSQAQAIVNQSYVDASPSNLRLDLPFRSAAVNRSAANSESLHQAEILFIQALAHRENMTDARLGLASIYLRESKLDRAREQFQKVLAVEKRNIQALIGRGITEYEESIQEGDPLKRRALLTEALGDFDEALEIVPDSAEALYNKILTLFESGQHKEALQGIEHYLSRDANSIWAEELKALKVKMQATQISALEDYVLRLAKERNKDVLTEIARLAPYQMPAVLMDALTQSVRFEVEPAMPGNPSSEDMLWAIAVMEPVYRSVTGDAGFQNMLAFHAGLSPPQRRFKRTLDRTLVTLDHLHSQGQFDEYLKISAPLSSQYAKYNDLWQVCEVHSMRLHAFYMWTADFIAAESEARKMLAAAERLNAMALKARAMSAIALCCNAQRKSDDALYYAGEAKRLAQSHALKSQTTYACLQLGTQYKNRGQFEQSFKEYATVLKESCRLSDDHTMVSALNNLGGVADRLGRLQDARAFYHQAIQQQNDFLKNRTGVPTPELNLMHLNLLFKEGELAFRSGDMASAEEFFRKSLESIPKGMYELEARNRLGLAEVHLRTNRIPESGAMVESIKRLNTSGKYTEIDWQTRSLEGRLQERAGHHEKALILLGQAIDILETMRRNIRSKDSRNSFFQDRFDPYKTMVSILSTSAKDKTRALEFADKAKSIVLRESLCIPELASWQAKNSTSIKTRLSSYHTVEYFFAVDELLIFLTRKDQVDVLSQNITKEEIRLQVREYLECVNRKDSPNINRLARRLYDELIAPVETRIQDTPLKTLIILPDGPLHLLPFAGLQDRQGRYLIEKMPLAYAPSRSVLLHCLLSNRKPFREDSRAMLINGSDGLPSAQKELSYLSKFLSGKAAILSSKDFPLFKQMAAVSGIVHFSGHTVEKHGEPALLLRAFPNEIYLDSPAIAGWKMPQAYLVNLAGCSTGIGPVSEGTSPWGLIPAFLNARAPAILASLAPVDDASTERLNFRFYEFLKNGVSKAEALQKAQIELLRSVPSNLNAQPQSWIPYVLIGNPI